MLGAVRVVSSVEILGYEEKVEVVRRLYAGRFDEFLRYAFSVVEPKGVLEWGWYLDCLSEYLMAVGRGEVRQLLVNMPPRCLKSIAVSVAFPAWLMARDAGTRVICASYGETLAKKHSMDCRLVIEDKFYRELFPGTRLSDEQNEKVKYVTTERGHRIATSVGGALTGEGGDCFLAGTLITTDEGDVPIDKIGEGVNVLSYCHESNEYTYKRVQAWREIGSEDIVEVSTIGGRSFRCTGNHRVFVEGQGYKSAKELRRGEALIAGSRDTIVLQFMRGDISKAALRDKKDAEEQSFWGRILQQRMFSGASFGKEHQKVRVLREQSEAQEQQVLFRGLFATWEKTYKGGKSRMQTLWGCVSWPRKAAILFRSVFGQGTFSTDVGKKEPSLQVRRGVQCPVFQDASINNRKRWWVRDLWRLRKFTYPSCKRGLERQYTAESNNSLCDSPYDTPQKQSDTVSSVRRIGCGKVPVYDIQVEGTNNFFANGILVHNCLIFDDLIKPDEALSDATRKGTNDWMTQVFMNRLNDKRVGKIIGVMQRVHQEDPCGLLLEQGGWTHLNMPAIYDKRVVYSIGKKKWVKEEGEYLDGERLGQEVLDGELKKMGEYAFAGQYLQNPAPAEGGMVKWGWFKRYEERPLTFEAVIQSWDTAVKMGVDNDYSVGMTWGIRWDGYYLLDVVRKKMQYPELKAEVRRIYERDLPRYILVEDKASGQQLLQDYGAQRGVPMLGIIPERSKTVRFGVVTDVIEQGKVWLPQDAPWLDALQEEIRVFPNGKHDDMIDAISLALGWLKINFDRLIESANVFEQTDPLMSGYSEPEHFTGRSRISGY